MSGLDGVDDSSNYTHLNVTLFICARHAPSTATAGGALVHLDGKGGVDVFGELDTLAVPLLAAAAGLLALENGVTSVDVARDATTAESVVAGLD